MFNLSENDDDDAWLAAVRRLPDGKQIGGLEWFFHKTMEKVIASSFDNPMPNAHKALPHIIAVMAERGV